ncbi:MAG: hypothetical protein ATN35_02065 [Epulopiscium sp. Nele67-Bin004]|nr:MAG: hypothetical protein ATN35_02065 [Epulopiscium sp. Nele67-Bin004]
MARDARRDKAFEIYRAAEGNINLIDVATDLNVPPGTIRGWKSKDKWDDILAGKEVQRSKNRSRNQAKKNIKEAVEIVDDTSLTDKQKLFCLYYSRSFNGTSSYMKAFNQKSRSIASNNATRLLKQDEIVKTIKQLKESKFSLLLLSESDIHKKLLDIAFADITDFVEFDDKEIKVKSSSLVDGTIIKYVKQDKYGVTIKLEDRVAALKWLSETIFNNDSDNNEFAQAAKKMQERLDLLEKQKKRQPNE